MNHVRPGLLKRQFIINKPLQEKLLLQALVCTIASSLTMVFGILILSESNSFANVALVGTLLTVLTCFIFGSTLFLSHSIAGPIYRLEHEMKIHLAGENVEPLVVRKGDHFPELIATFNSLVKKSHSGQSLNR